MEAFFGIHDADEVCCRSNNRRGVHAPAVDDTVYADSCSLVINALVCAYYATGRNDYLALAVKSRNFELENLSAGGMGALHAVRGESLELTAFSPITSYSVQQCYLHNATAENKCLTKAKQIGRLIIDHFYDAGANRFRIFLDVSLMKPVTVGVYVEINDDLANYRALLFLSSLKYYCDFSPLREICDTVAASFLNVYTRFAP